MSGIAGIVDFSGRPVYRCNLEGMTAEMAYRGPDGIGHWHDQVVGLGQCMFHTTPEALEADLPLTSRDGNLVLVMDGRVDNFEDLRRLITENRGRLRNRSDAELVLAAYGLWGEDCLREIDGDFAIAIWDTRQRHLFCGRDRLGFKPFFYHWNGTRFFFASDIAALQKCSEILSAVDETMIAQVLSDDFICQEQTIWAGIKRLPTAHRAVVTSAGIAMRKYWAPDLDNVVRYRRQEEYVEHYRELLFDEVRRASRTIGPVGCEVSGGLDSSAIFSVADALVKSGDLPARDLLGYTLKFEKGSPVDDLRCARALKNYSNRAIKEVPAARPPLDWFAEFARRHRTIVPRPNASMHTSIHSAAKEDHCQVVLTGIGGDEWLIGSRYAAAELIAGGDLGGLCGYLASLQQFHGTIAAARVLMRFGIYPLAPSSFRGFVRKIRGISEARKTAEDIISPKLRKELEACRMAARSRNNGGSGDKRTKFNCHQLDVLRSPFLARAKEMMELLASLEGIELRAPLSSRRMVEFCFAVPHARRGWGDVNRSIHRSAIAGLVPVEIEKRTTKSVFDGIYRSYSAEIVGKTTWQSYVLESGWVSSRPLGEALNDATDTNSEFAPHGNLWRAYSCSFVENMIK